MYQQKVQELKLAVKTVEFTEGKNPKGGRNNFVIIDESSEDKREYFAVETLKDVIKMYLKVDSKNENVKPVYICTEKIEYTKGKKTLLTIAEDITKVLNFAVRAAVVNDSRIAIQFKNKDGKWVMKDLPL
jgi:hypothetical protein